MVSIQHVLNAREVSIREEWIIKWEGWGDSKQKRDKEYQVDKLGAVNTLGRIYVVSPESKEHVRKDKKGTENSLAGMKFE